MKQELIDALIGISGKDYVFFAHEDIEGYLYDETEEFVRPEACQDCVVIRPGTYEEVSAILKLCNETKTPVIPGAAAPAPAARLFRRCPPSSCPWSASGRSWRWMRPI